MHAEIIGVRELQFLMRAANCERGVVKLSGIESGRNPDVIFQSLRELTVKLQTAFAPGARDNSRFDEVAFHAIVSRRLVRFVEYAKRDQKQPALDVEGIVDAVVDESLLKLGLASVAAAYYGMFELEFGIKADAVIEAMAKELYEAP